MSIIDTFPALTVEFIKENVGKEITWFANGYKGNLPYKGVCKLLGIENNRPVVEHIKGDDLSYGKAHDGELITYTDSDRPVFIGSPFDIYQFKSGGNFRDFVVYEGDSVEEIAKGITTVSEFEIEHLV